MKVIIQTNVTTLDRLSRQQTFMAMAIVMSMRGTCKRAQVGCVITQENRIVSTGYNGSLSDTHCIECRLDLKCKDAVHAEANAISFAAREGIALKGATLYCNYAPCYECAKLIYQAGISDVYFEKLYETDNGEGLILLREKNIGTLRV